jgi:hypothetical protein
MRRPRTHMRGRRSIIRGCGSKMRAITSAATLARRTPLQTAPGLSELPNEVLVGLAQR